MSVWHASRASASASSSPIVAAQPADRQGRGDPPSDGCLTRGAGRTRVVSVAEVRLLRVLADQFADRHRLRLAHQVALVLIARALLRSLDGEQ
jgi:hypothetical protein